MRTYFKIIACTAAAASLAAAAGLSRPALAAGKPAVPVTSPAIQMTLEPFDSSGHMRIYPIKQPLGASYWTTDLPIYKGDTVHLDVFVATGSDELQELKVRLDNNLIADGKNSPWAATFDTKALTPGYHHIEAWAQVSGPHAQYIDHTLSFMVSDMTEAQAVTFSSASAVPNAPANSGGIQRVAPYTGVLGPNGQVTPIGSAPDVTTTGIVTTPTIFASATETPDATVKITPRDTVTGADLPMTAGQPLTVSTAMNAHITPASHSKALRFVYGITRNGYYIVPPTEELALGMYDITLRPTTATAQGLIDGPATLWVWGVDASGNYSAPQFLDINVAAAAGS